jgi:hypothetical protein
MSPVAGSRMPLPGSHPLAALNPGTSNISAQRHAGDRVLGTCRRCPVCSDPRCSRRVTSTCRALMQPLRPLVVSIRLGSRCYRFGMRAFLPGCPPILLSAPTSTRPGRHFSTATDHVSRVGPFRSDLPDHDGAASGRPEGSSSVRHNQPPKLPTSGKRITVRTCNVRS